MLAVRYRADLSSICSRRAEGVRALRPSVPRVPSCEVASSQGILTIGEVISFVDSRAASKFRRLTLQLVKSGNGTVFFSYPFFSLSGKLEAPAWSGCMSPKFTPASLLRFSEPRQRTMLNIKGNRW